VQCELAVLIDGEVVARSGISSEHLTALSQSCVGMPFVAPGTHTIELAIRTYKNCAVNGRSLWGRRLSR
jgi:hypothetical protein